MWWVENLFLLCNSMFFLLLYNTTETRKLLLDVISQVGNLHGAVDSHTRLWDQPSFLTIHSILTSFFIQFLPFSDADEPQPHLPITAMTTKPSPEGLTATIAAPSPASLPKAEAPTGEAGDYPFMRGQLVAPLHYVIVCRRCRLLRCIHSHYWGSKNN